MMNRLKTIYSRTGLDTAPPGTVPYFVHRSLRAFYRSLVQPGSPVIQKPPANNEEKRQMFVVKDDHREITWWHSIDLGNGVVTNGSKTPALLQEEFARLNLTAPALRDKRVLDIGCNDGYICLRCEELGADVVGIDGIHRDGLKYVRQHLKPKFKFFCMDIMSPSFCELGRFDVILYLGVLYHTIYPFEQLLRIANACNPNATLLLESAYYDLAGFENEPTIMFNYDGRLESDLTTPVLPSVQWIVQTLARIGFEDVAILHKEGPSRGRVTIRARYRKETGAALPLLFASEQA